MHKEQSTSNVIVLELSDIQHLSQEEAKNFVNEILQEQGLSVDETLLLMQNAQSAYQAILLIFAGCLAKKGLIDSNATFKFDSSQTYAAAGQIILKALEENASQSFSWQERLHQNIDQRHGLI